MYPLAAQPWYTVYPLEAQVSRVMPAMALWKDSAPEGVPWEDTFRSAIAGLAFAHKMACDFLCAGHALRPWGDVLDGACVVLDHTLTTVANRWNRLDRARPDHYVLEDDDVRESCMTCSCTSRVCCWEYQQG